MKIYCYDDAHHWGSMLAAAANKRGHSAHLFDDPRFPESGYVFMHMHHHPQVRLLHKRVMAIMATNPELRLIPDYRSSVLYDDKLEQARQLSRWMPRTRVFYTPGSARRFLGIAPVGSDQQLTPEARYPFISKAADGASSHNVRLIKSVDDAKVEVRQAFSDIGIKCRYGQTQRGYLLWQDFVPANDGDIRIIAIGKKRLVLRRGNRLDRPMASGSGKLEPIVNFDDAEAYDALLTANDFFREENFNWCGVDMVYDHNRGQWMILETTVGWTLNGYYGCRFIDCSGRQPELDGRMGDAIWDVLIDEIEAGHFDGA